MFHPQKNFFVAPWDEFRFKRRARKILGFKVTDCSATRINLNVFSRNPTVLSRYRRVETPFKHAAHGPDMAVRLVWMNVIRPSNQSKPKYTPTNYHPTPRIRGFFVRYKYFYLCRFSSLMYFCLIIFLCTF